MCFTLFEQQNVAQNFEPAGVALRQPQVVPLVLTFGRRILKCGTGVHVCVCVPATIAVNAGVYFCEIVYCCIQTGAVCA